MSSFRKYSTVDGLPDEGLGFGTGYTFRHFVTSEK